MLRSLILIGFFSVFSKPFIISSGTDHQRCYELELENCFREAFLSAIHPPLFHKRELSYISNKHNDSALYLGKNNENKKQIRQIQVCHDVRKFSSCFIFPGCTDQQAANIASVQYHMVFGKKLPMNVFLAYRGYGREMCDQQCSKDIVLHCTKKMNEKDQQEEQGYLLELSSIIGHIAPNRDTTVACTRFSKVLVNLIRLRRIHCGEMARCTCTDSTVQQGVDGCNSGCEHLLYLNMDEVTTNFQFSFCISLPNIVLVIYVLYMLNIS